MRHYEATAQVRARPEAVWDVLVDVAEWPAWGAGARVEGRAGPGEKLKVRTDANPGRAFPVRVTGWEPPRLMTWTGGMPLGLFRGVRTFRLEPGARTTRLTVREEYRGPLLPLVWRSMPDLQPTFDRFAEALRERVERER